MMARRRGWDVSVRERCRLGGSGVSWRVTKKEIELCYRAHAHSTSGFSMANISVGDFSQNFPQITVIFYFHLMESLLTCRFLRICRFYFVMEIFEQHGIFQFCYISSWHCKYLLLLCVNYCIIVISCLKQDIRVWWYLFYKGILSSDCVCTDVSYRYCLQKLVFIITESRDFAQMRLSSQLKYVLILF